MERDINVIEHLLDSMEDSTKKLNQALKKNDIKEIDKIKKLILDISKDISEELKWV